MVENVLLITPFAPPNIGGVETHIEDYYNYLAKSGYNVTVLTYQPLTSKIKGLSIEKHKNLTIHRFNWIGFNLFPRFEKFPPIFNFLYLTPYLGLRSFIFMLKNRETVDVIHAFGLNSAFIARILGMIFNKNIYVSMEALYEFNSKTFFGKVCKWVFDGFHTVLVGSEESKVDVMNLGVPATQIFVYTHWIDLDHFKPQNKKTLKKKLGWKDTFTVIYVGRLIPIKGIAVFLEVAKMSNKNIQFVIAGDGTEADKVRAAAKEFPNILYLGRVPNTEVATYYAASDMLIYPALYNEDLSLVLLESLATGTPVINTNMGSGVYKLQKDFAFVVPADPKKMKEKVELLYKDPVLRNSMAKNGIQFANKFGIELADLIIQKYEKKDKS